MDFPILNEAHMIEITTDVSFTEVLDILSEKLENGGYITSKYKETILNNLAANGPYFVLAPYIALPHSQNVEEVYHTGIAVLKSKQPVDVGGMPVHVFIMLASTSPESHLELLMQMVSLMDTEEKQTDFVTSDFQTLKQKMLALVKKE